MKNAANLSTQLIWCRAANWVKTCDRESDLVTNVLPEPYQTIVTMTRMMIKDKLESIRLIEVYEGRTHRA